MLHTSHNIILIKLYNLLYNNVQFGGSRVKKYFNSLIIFILSSICHEICSTCSLIFGGPGYSTSQEVVGILPMIHRKLCTKLSIEKIIENE